MNINLNVYNPDRYTQLFNNVILNKQITGEIRTTGFFYKNIKKGRFYDIDNEFISPDKFAEQMDNIISVLNHKLENRWDFFLRPVISANIFLGFEIFVVIHYPSILISNSIGSSRDIQDLIVLFQIKTSEQVPSELTVMKPKGCRSTLSFEEWYSSYQHSHLTTLKQGSYADCFYTTEFCIGGGTELSELLVDMWDSDYTFNSIKFESYLYALDSLVEWESLEGIPYLSIDKISVADNATLPRVISKDYLETYYRTFRSTLSSLDVDFYLSKDRFKIKSNSKFIDFLRKNIQESDLSNVLLYFKVLGDEQMYAYNGNTQENNNEESLSIKFQNRQGQTPYIFIQGNKLEYKVLPYEGELVNIEAFKVHPNFIEYAKQQLEQELYTKYITKSTITRYYQSSNAR